MESMTGVATSRIRLGSICLDVLMRSVNHRYLDIHIRAPAGMLALHRMMDEVARHQFRRGRIDIEIKSEHTDLFQKALMQHAITSSYLKWLGVKNMQALETRDRLHLLRLPGVLELESVLPEKTSERQWKQALSKAVLELQKSRRIEGRKIATVLRGYLKGIDGHIREISRAQKLSQKERESRLQAEIKRRLEHTEVGPWLAEWLEKGSIAEELERLKMHLGAVRAMLKGPENDIGKKLDFYAQEMLREANTIASKTRDFSIRASVIEIKSIVEDIKEQGRNLC